MCRNTYARKTRLLTHRPLAGSAVSESVVRLLVAAGVVVVVVARALTGS